MPPDIRSFFGGGSGGGAVKPAAPPSKKQTNGEKSSKKPRGRKVVSDDDEEEAVEAQPKKSNPIRTKKSAPPVKEEETTSSAYFASGKSKSTKPASSETLSTPTKKKDTNGGATPSSTRRSARKAVKNYAEESDEDVKKVDDKKDGGDDDIYAENYSKTRIGGDDYEEASEDDVVVPVTKTRKASSVKSKKAAPDTEDSDLDMQEIPAFDGAGDSKKKRASTASTASRKRKTKDSEEELEDEEDEVPKKKARKTTTTPRKPRAKKEEEPESKEIQILKDSIPTVRAPTPPPRDETKKFKFQPGGGNASVAPSGGAAEIPNGAENCLAGLTFVFTGVLDTLGRDEGQALVKKYGGKITSGPSSKTSYVVLGKEAGPKKLETIKKMNITTIDENGLFHIIRTFPANGGDSKAAAKNAEKKEAEREKIKAEAEEMEKREKEKEREAAKAAKAAAERTGVQAPVKSEGPKVEDRLWVDKYAPDQISSVCGNKGLVEKLQNWLRNWPKRAKYDFKQAGPDGSGIYRAAMLHGPPGIGKTTAAHLVAKLEGYDVVESNASDTRSKKMVENGLTGVLDTTSMLGYFAGDGKKVEASKRKLLLIMDEVDGMSAGDRGGVGALAAVAKKTKVPMILICNDRKLPKMKPFDFVTADFPFRRPSTDMIRGRIATICYREGIRMPPQVIDALIEGSHADIRQIINMISTVKTDNKQMDYNDSKAMSKAWEKHIILKPWDIVNKILRPEMFSPSSSATLNDKTELYFNDHEFSYLMLQENYLKTRPMRANTSTGREHKLKLLELVDNAAESISDGDLVDRMIHGSQQQWSLMPTHAMFSFVRPASYMYGNFGEQVGFTSWLGNNSKQGKLSRYIKEIQGHMRLRASGDRHEVRQQYLPALWNRTVKVLRDEGKESVQGVIDFMDSYYLTKDDFEAMQELGLGPMDQSSVKLETQTKASFTRLYNSQSHPMPFIKASALGNAAAKMGGGKRDKPDLEEAVDESDDEVAVAAEVDEGDDEELDLKKDKYVKVSKKKTTAATSKATKGKGKRAKDEVDNDEDEDGAEEERKPKKRGAGAATRGRGGARGGRGKGKA